MAVGQIAASPDVAGAATSGLASVEPFAVEAADGVVLRGHVYLPATRKPLATVLVWSPYWGALYGSTGAQEQTVGGRRTIAEPWRPFLDAGFAFAAVSIRGSGASDGCLDWGSTTDRRDGYRVVEALAARPWSNGRIGMFGASYDGWSQAMAMGGAPPSLKAVIPVSGVVEPWSLVTRNGAPIHGGVVFTPTWTAIGATGSPAKVLERAGCPNLGRDLLISAELVANGDRTEWFRARDLRPAVAASRVPMFFTNGLYTLRVPTGNQEGHILQVNDLWSLRPGKYTRLMLGQWGHSYPTPYRPDFPHMAVAWFDHHLRGGPPVVRTGVVDYEDDTGKWRRADRWPPKSRPVTLRLGDGTLRLGPPSVSSQTFQSDGADPGLAVSPMGKGAIAPCGPRQALYVSPPLAHDVQIAGNAEIEVTVTSTLDGGDLAAILLHTPGPGTCPDLAALESVRAITDLRHWKRTGVARPFPALTATTVRLKSHPFASVLPKGHRLVLALAGGAHEVVADPLKPIITISTGPGVAGSVRLPVVSGALTFEE